jgi:ABC-2 type transport system ATP-binding protein
MTNQVKIKKHGMAIQVENLTRKFGDFVAVDDISFDVPAGQIFGFLGPNGSGKTTTIRMLLGLLKPTTGTAMVLGQDIRTSSRQLLQQMGYMSQKFSLYTDLTVTENLKFFGRGYGLSGRELRERMDFVIDMAGLKGHERSRTSELSGGWAQRLALGTAIMHRPKLIFLDEPTAGVDPISRRKFWDLLYQLSQQGTTIFVTTHYMDEAEHCESVGFIYYGRIIAHGAPNEIISQTLPGQVIAFEPSDPLQAKAQIETAIQSGQINADGVSLFGAAVHVLTNDVPQAQTFLNSYFTQQGIEINGDLQIEDPSLEDAFIELVNRADAVTG